MNLLHYQYFFPKCLDLFLLLCKFGSSSPRPRALTLTLRPLALTLTLTLTLTLYVNPVAVIRARCVLREPER